MYLKNVLDQNPNLPKVALQLHQEGKIPPNTWVIDLDTIVDNARVLSMEARRLGLTTYLMSKQHNRNPYINALALAAGLNKLVAVDGNGVLAARRYSIPLGHVGHLNQIPRHLVPLTVSLRPEVFTVYNIEHAKWINEAAEKQGVVQDVLIRVYHKDDIFFDGQEAGFEENDVPSVAQALAGLNNIRLVGVTAFPCLTYNETADDTVAITPNMHTIIRASQMLGHMGIEVKQVNAPGNTSSRVMALLKEHGATHVEPGNALLGTVPDNAFRNDTAERTAFVYVTEISHYFKNRAYAYGGGVFHTSYTNKIEGLVGADWDQARTNAIEYLHDIEQNIDYHMQLLPQPGQRCEVGDCAIFAYRTQMHMTRSYVAPVSGISGKRPLKVHYLFDNAVTALDADFNQVSPAVVRKDIDALITTYF